jgi:ATP-binding cassette subfamily B protein
MLDQASEFRSGEAIHYNTATPGRWILSHVGRYPWLPLLALFFSIGNNIGYSGMQVLIGRGLDVLATPDWSRLDLLRVAMFIAGASFLQGIAGIGRNMSFEFLAQKIERDARAELFESLIGKSQAFHSSQRVGDLMARATNDVHFLNLMFSPGLALIVDSALTTIIPLVMVAIIDPRLLLVPILFIFALAITVWLYNHRLNPLTDEQRERFGELNAGLADALEGIETVKANLGEARETTRFANAAGRLRDLYIKIAREQGRYWPLLIFAVAWGLGFMHALLLWRSGQISVGQAVGYMMLYNAFRFTTFISLFSFNLFQMGLSSAGRVLDTIRTKTDLDENPSGRTDRIQGRVEFRNVSFTFASISGTCQDPSDQSDPSVQPSQPNSVNQPSRSNQPAMTLADISFRIEPGQTVAIVGRTGSGKTTLARLVTRVFDACGGQVLVDGVDVREWSLEHLRSQTAAVEQDVFLFGRSIRDNIAFGKPDASARQVERAAREAQAHDFIIGFEHGYDTMVGDRGVTLSGGQKQRIAIARAFIADPRILILDDSTSAVDSRTEDEIQQAMRRVGQGRTTFLITHRLSQIRWADHILLLEGGRLAAQGSHEQLLLRSADYRRLFARV